MGNLGFEDAVFDLIWSEGALYSIGFKEGLGVCQKLLVPDGLLALSELTWLKDVRPAECSDFFANEYPSMKDIESNLELIRESGFEILDYFVLPKIAWDRYYLPLEDRVKEFEQLYADDQERLDIINSIQVEIDIYHKYLGCYGYVFYLMKRN